MICVTGKNSQLKCSLFSPLDLSIANKWEMGFLDLMTYNSIPNIEENVNNAIYFSKITKIALPTGTYEIDNINSFIKRELKKNSGAGGIKIELNANNNTLKSELFCSEEIGFTKTDFLGTVLGFTEPVVLEANKWHVLPSQVAINKVDVIQITCNIVRNSYRDGVEGHVLHEFYPSVPPGYKILEVHNTVK